MDAIMVFVGIGFILTGVVLHLAGMKQPEPVVEENTESPGVTARTENLQLRGTSLVLFGFAVNVVYFMFLH